MELNYLIICSNTIIHSRGNIRHISFSTIMLVVYIYIYIYAGSVCMNLSSIEPKSGVDRFEILTPNGLYVNNALLHVLMKSRHIWCS